MFSLYLRFVLFIIQPVLIKVRTWAALVRNINDVSNYSAPSTAAILDWCGAAPPESSTWSLDTPSLCAARDSPAFCVLCRVLSAECWRWCYSGYHTADSCSYIDPLQSHSNMYSRLWKTVYKRTKMTISYQLKLHKRDLHKA